MRTSARARFPRGLALIVLLAVTVSLPAASATAQSASPPNQSDYLWADSEGQPLPFTSHDEAEAFLLAANVISSEEFGVGITGLQRLVMEHDGIRVRAAFHDYHELERDAIVDERRYREHHDSYRNQCAAYVLARLLHLDNVPPTVCRTVDGVDGSVQLWVEGAYTEEERAAQNVRPPDTGQWSRQIQHMRLFDSLIYNDDRHARNFMMDQAGTLWLIDHTRGFQHTREPLEPERFSFCERPLWERLRSVTDEELGAALGEYLDVAQLAALRRRRAALVELIQARIEVRGEAATLMEVETGR